MAAGAAMLLSACESMPLPDLTPTQEEVPFLGQQLTQAQIAEWRARVEQQRSEMQSAAQAERVACYQHFFVNSCLEDSRRKFLQQHAVLRKQQLELNRQERVLREVDRQLRVQQKQQSFPDAVVP